MPRSASFYPHTVSQWIRVLAALPLWLALTGMPHGVQAQSVSTHIHQQVEADVHGADRKGKDGPLAKVGRDLALLYREYEAHQQAGAKRSFTPSNRRMRVRSGYVTVDAVADRDAATLQDALRALGLKGAARAGRMVSGRLPIEAIPDAAALADLRFARPSRAFTFTGSVTSQGDAAMNADQARADLGVDGSGVTVGVLSDSYDTDDGADTDAKDDVDSGDLPDNVQVLEDYGDEDGEDESVRDEGRAMLQIVHDVAPAADLAFHTAMGGQASFVQAIHNLAVAGADVIVDDLWYLREPMFQDGIIAQAVDSAKSEGIAYFSSAGNLADQSYESDFRDSGEMGPLGEGTLHDFDPGAEVDALQKITIPKGTAATFILQWDDSFASAGGPGAATDLDIFVMDANGDSVLAQASDPNIDGDAVEILDIDSDTSSVDREFLIGIKWADGPAPNVVKYVFNPGSVAIDDAYGDAGKSSLFGHANATGARAIGAASHGSNKKPRGYTALGGTPVYFDADGTRKSTSDPRDTKPELAAPDCVDNTFFGDGNTFCGTSAAAPHAAAVAALMWEHRPDLTVDELYAELEDTALDIGDGGFDNLSGNGFIQADQAALPVELARFDVVVEDEEVILTWTTASETDNAGFEVQAQGPGDADTWERLGFVEGYGTTAEMQRYRYRATDLAPGPHAFRLRQIDTDGTAQVSPVVEATVGLDSPYRLSPVYPNPVRGAATLQLLVREPQDVRAVAYDAIGRRVQILHDGTVAAYEPVRLQLGAETLSSGLYLIQVEGERFSATRRAVVVK